MAPEPIDPLDPHRTAALRRAVLQTWTASTARFREDANAEELLARGYADRVLVELAANAVDAARSAGVRAVLAVERVDLPDGSVQIRVANTGSPLTSDGVRALASLRASAKRDTASTIGHFGVGFTAVRALSDEPALLSTTGSVRFSASRTAEDVAALGIPELDAELRRRDGVIPALRLCWPLPDSADDGVPPEFSSQVRLPLRAGIDADAVLEGWRRSVLDELWWALPSLDEVRLQDLTITRERDEPRTAPDSAVLVRREHLLETGPAATAARRSFLTAESRGELPAALLADRPVEERDRADWRLCWSLPEPADDAAVGPGGAFDPFADRGPDPERTHAIGAPTATDDLLTVPARLVGTFPVDETRRRISLEPLTDHLLALSVDAYLGLAMALRPEARWDLVPPQDFPAGDLDARLRALIVRRLAEVPLLVGVLGDPVEPRTASCCPDLDGPTAAAVAEAIPALVEVPVGARTAARLLGVTSLSLAEAVDALSSVVRPPRWWAQVYRGLAGADADALTGLPVPLADGRQVIGARGVLLPTPALQELTQAVTAVLPTIRWVAAEAADDLLVRIGAVPADPDAILASSALQDELAAVAADLEADLLDEIVLPDPGTPQDDELARDPAVAAGALAALVLDLIAAGGTPDPPVLTDLVLGTEDGEPWPAAELLLPEATLGSVLVPDALPLIGRAWVQRWGTAVLERAGVRAGLLVVPIDDPRADRLLPDLDDFQDGEDGSPDRHDGELGVADLDLVDDWPAFLALLEADPEARAAVLTRPGSRSYTGWWIAEHAAIDGLAPDRFRLAGPLPAGSPLALLPAFPVTLSREIAVAVGVVGSEEQFAALVEDDPQAVLDRFCDPAVALDPAAVTAVVALLVRRLAEDDSVHLPDRIRVCDGSVRPADEVIVPDGPWWSQVLPASGVLATRTDAELTAEVFGLPFAAAAGALAVSGSGAAADPISAVTAVLGPDHRTPQTAASLTVRDPDGHEHRVVWWPQGSSTICDGSDLGLASALAWANDRWADRREILAAIRGDAAGELLARVWD